MSVFPFASFPVGFIDTIILPTYVSSPACGPWVPFTVISGGSGAVLSIMNCLSLVLLLLPDRVFCPCFYCEYYLFFEVKVG